MSRESIQEIINEMHMDINVDIYGDIYGHERWAEEIFRLRNELRRMKEQANEDSWSRNPDRMGGQFTQQEIDEATRGGHGW